ncbi:MAG: gliding motility-associated C-terminal domain-containing protein [Flavobacteriales bacterium]|nr:gliding motility-associated C-terminal domain-containing protein [Flavobacteriales bacterium]
MRSAHWSAIVPLFLVGGTVLGQCVAPIATFPYVEDFEGGPAWTTGGVVPDWAWGMPAHPLINTAGGGLQSWCIGGLTGTFYNFGQLSWLQSPCFDMSALDQPWISFKIYWECERQYDGMNLQVSTDAGLTWSNVGAWGDPVDCLNDNWFNSGNITNLTTANPKHGWSGRVGPTVGNCQGGNGSGGWVEAKHCVPQAANASAVVFRFLFGAGTTCNDYDGIAVDDVLIQQAPQTTAAFSYTCAGSVVSFLDESASCPGAYAWDFGDPGSGALNTSNQPSPSHTYPGPGTYPVTLSVTGPCSPMSSITLSVVVPEVFASSTDPLCFGGSGSVEAIMPGSDGTETYLWQPGGQTDPTVSGLSAGQYTITVTTTSGCSSSATATVVEPAPLEVEAMADLGICEGANVQLTATTSGGTGGVTVQWTPFGPSVAPTSTTTYSVVAVDANGCQSLPDEVVITVGQAPTPVVSIGPTTGCAPWCVDLSDMSPGAAQVQWELGDGATAMGASYVHCFQGPGIYSPTVSIADGAGCDTTVALPAITVLAPPVVAIGVTPAVVNAEDPFVTVSAIPQNAATWSWSLGAPVFASSTDPSVTARIPAVGCHPVQLIATSTDGCSDTARAEVCMEERFQLHVPNAFTPDGDGFNDVFLPVTNAFRLQDYELLVYDRWGGLVFSSGMNEPAWDGTSSGSEAPMGVYGWVLSVRDPFGERYRAQGHVTLLR